MLVTNTHVYRCQWVLQTILHCWPNWTTSRTKSTRKQANLEKLSWSQDSILTVLVMCWSWDPVPWFWSWDLVSWKLLPRSWTYCLGPITAAEHATHIYYHTVDEPLVIARSKGRKIARSCTVQQNGAKTTSGPPNNSWNPAIFLFCSEQVRVIT